MSADDDLWPVIPSDLVGDTLADPAVSAEVFSTVAALTVAIRENPWLSGSDQVGADPDWREILIPRGYGIAEYRISRRDHHVILTRICLF
ncbi:hypothetical protein [Planotetraspora sp. GP83]|uniref:hypothetical protein n=1 Tax=Planotetraspora sp. GP83 TaxID=3156264 RepID=UPI0035112730